MTELWYKTCCFEFSAQGLDILGHFLKTDVLGYGLKPAELVQRLALTVVLTTNRDYKRINSPLQNLEQLFALRTPRCAFVTLRVLLDGGERGLHRFLSFIPAGLAPMVNRLDDKGTRLELKLCMAGRWEWHIGDSASRSLQQTLREFKEVRFTLFNVAHLFVLCY